MPTGTDPDLWRESLPVNRLAAAGCFEGEAGEGSTWAEVEDISPEVEEDLSPDRTKARMLLRARLASPDLRTEDPIGAVLDALDTSALSRSRLSELIESAVAEVLSKQLDAVVEKRVDAVLADRAKARRRAEAVFGRLLANLEATAGPEEEISKEEEMELWEMANFPALDQDED